MLDHRYLAGALKACQCVRGCCTTNHTFNMTGRLVKSKRRQIFIQFFIWCGRSHTCQQLTMKRRSFGVVNDSNSRPKDRKYWVDMRALTKGEG